MKQFTMKLDRQHKRPVVVLNNGLTALLDTGAYIPIWTDNEEILVSRLGAQIVQKNVSILGFGGAAYGNLYKVTLDIGGILYPNMHIVANSELNVSFNLILSATMFDGLIYQIDTVNHVLNVDIPDSESNIRNLRIVNEKGKLFVLCGEYKESNLETI